MWRGGGRRERFDGRTKRREGLATLGEVRTTGGREGSKSSLLLDGRAWGEEIETHRKQGKFAGVFAEGTNKHAEFGGGSPEAKEHVTFWFEIREWSYRGRRYESGLAEAKKKRVEEQGGANEASS